MAVIPYIPTATNLEYEILLNDSISGLHTVLKKASVHYELNKIPFAKLHFIASNPDTTEDDDLLKNAVIAVNDIIEIKVRNGEDPVTLFRGMVFKLEKNVDPEAGFETKIECKDIAVNLMSQQEVIPDETFNDKMTRFLNHISVENQVTLEVGGDETVSKTSNVTPWDYIVSYLDALGMMTTLREGIFSAFDSTAEVEEAVYVAKNGVNVFEFEGREEEIVSSVQVRVWNPETQTVDTQEAETQTTAGATPSEGTELIDMSQSNYSTETIQKMTAARAAKNVLASVKGMVKTFGNTTAKYGQYISFEKVNSALDDRPLLISKEYHTIENGCWNTEYSFGLESNNSFAENTRASTTTNTARMGQTNTMGGLQIGIITQLQDDPGNQFRVRVRNTSVSETGDGVWARLASIQAGNGRGGFFIPEVGDEVILGNLNDNPDAPIILGKLYSSANPPPFDITAENYEQGIVTKEETRIVLNDEDKSIEISTKKGNKFLLSDKEKGFILEDENSNKIIMNADGITIESAKDIMLKAGKDIKTEGVKQTIKASAMMEVKGQMIKLN